MGELALASLLLFSAFCGYSAHVWLLNRRFVWQDIPGKSRVGIYAGEDSDRPHFKFVYPGNADLSGFVGLEYFLAEASNVQRDGEDFIVVEFAPLLVEVIPDGEIIDLRGVSKNVT